MVEDKKPNNIEEKKEVQNINSEPKMQGKDYLKLFKDKVFSFFTVFFAKTKSFFVKVYKIIKKYLIIAFKKLKE